MSIESNESKKLKIEIYTSPTCPYCPAALKMLKDAVKIYENALDVVNVNIITKEGQTLAAFYNVRATPTIVINNEVKFRGSPPSESILFREIEKYLDDDTIKIARMKKKKKRDELNMMYS